MKVVLISDNGNRNKKKTINICLSIYILFITVLLLAAGVAVVNKYFFISQNLVSKSDNKENENLSQVLSKLNTQNPSRSRLDINDFGLSKQPIQGEAVKPKYFGSTFVRKKDVSNNDIKKSLSSTKRDLDKQKLKLKNLVASLEITEAEEYLVQLSHFNMTNAIKPTEKHQGFKEKRITYDFSTPLLKGYISSPYGKRRDPINGSLRHHAGLDIATKAGSNVYAIANGFVSFSGRLGAYGKLVEIKHSESLMSRYAHLESYLVEKGQLVRKGDLIGKVGVTGRVTGPHLHLEIKENNKTIDPKLFLNDALKNL